MPQDKSFDDATINTIVDGATGNTYDPDDIGSGSGGSVLDTGSLGTLLSTNNSQDFTVTGVSTDETEEISDVGVSPSASTGFASYAIDAVDWWAEWDGSAWNVTITVNWMVDSPPGDLDLDYAIYEGVGGTAGSGLTKDAIYYSGGVDSGFVADGSNDGTAIQNAIDATARNGRAVIVPEINVDLDLDQEITLPADENGFRLLTDGRPTLVHASGTGLSHAIRKPAHAGQVQGYRIGTFEIVDNDGTLDPAISMADIKGSVIERTYFRDCPAIEILSENDQFSNQNVILYPWIKGDFDGSRQAGILLAGSSGTADQNWVYSPYYNETSPSSTPATVAYEDHGAFNSWIFTRCEWADTVHKFDGCREYYVSEGGWDRNQDFRRTVEELNGAHGQIDIRSGSEYRALEIHAPHTRLNARGAYIDRPTPTGTPTNVLESLDRVTGARTLASMGLRDNSTGGGSATIGGSFFDHPRLRLSTGGASGDTAVLDLGDQAMKAVNAYPKGAYSFGGDTTDVLVRTGVYNDANNYAELIYDPNNSMGNHAADNWYLEVVDGGTEQGSIDLGVAPTATPQGQFQTMSLCCLNTGSAGPGDETTAWVEGMAGGESISNVPDGGGGQGTWRWSVEALAAADKTWDIEPRDTHRLYRT